MSYIIFYRLIRLLPNFLWPLKIILKKNSIKSHGKKFRIGPNVILYDYKKITVGDNVYIGDGSIIAGYVPITIGNNVMFGPEVLVMAGDHNINVVGVHMAKVKEGSNNLPITIENDVWIGARAIILKGVTIREGAVVGAGSLVNKDILPYSINVGVPSKAVKCRFTKGDLEKHLPLVNSKYSLKEITELYKNNNLMINV